MIWKEGWNSLTNSFILRTHIINNIQTLHLHQILKKLIRFFSSYHATKKMTLYSRKNFEYQKVIVRSWWKFTYIISLSHTKLSINLDMIHRADLQILQFEKKVKKILTSNISEIYGPIILSTELDRQLSKIYLYKQIWSLDIKKLIFFIYQVLRFLIAKEPW